MVCVVDKENLYAVADKWGYDVASRGFAQIPNYLLLLNQFLDEDVKLTPVELLVLLQIVGIWWKKEELPFPSISKLSERCGVSDRQIQRAISSLEKKKLLTREKRRSSGVFSTNAYNLQPLIGVLSDVAKHFPNAFPRNLKKAKRPLLRQTSTTKP